MWNRLLDRIAPVMDEDTSDLDRRDGVGALPPVTEPTSRPARSHRSHQA
jgi:hypothetical protein